MGTGCARFSGWKWIFPSPSPSINHFFCLVLAKPKGKKKTCFMMQVRRAVSPGPKLLSRLCLLRCCPAHSPMPSTSPRTVHPQVQSGFIWAKVKPGKPCIAALAPGRATRGTTRSFGTWLRSRLSLGLSHPLQSSYRNYCTLFCRGYCWPGGEGRSTKGDTAQLPDDSPSYAEASCSPRRARPASCTPAAAAKSCISPEDECSLQS